MRIVTDDGVGLEVVERGTGPALLLVHGFGGAKEDFADQVDALARDHHVVTFDHRGHGESDGPEDPARYSLDRFAADLGNVLDALGIDPFRLLGHSMGGMIVRRFVLASPHRVDALVLMDTSPGPVPGLDGEIIELGVQIAQRAGHGRAQADHGRVPAARHRRRTSGRSSSGPATRSSATEVGGAEPGDVGDDVDRDP